MNIPEPVIVVPGITATELSDNYPLPSEDIWFQRKVLGIPAGVGREYERVTLHPDDLRYEAREPALVRTGSVFQVVYKELMEELRYGLSLKKNYPIPVYPFSYDWRQPLDNIEMQLANFIEEVLDRTRLMSRNYPDYANCNKVNLVGHSMGGLIIAGYLASHSSHCKVRKVVSLASPFQGSYEAIVKMTTGTAKIGISEQRSRERKAARLTPSLYHLVPSFENSLHLMLRTENLPRHFWRDLIENANWFNPKCWQSSIVKSISDYISEYGTSQEVNSSHEFFSNLLRTAKKHRNKIDQLNLENTGLEANDWLCVIGVDAKTRINIPVKETLVKQSNDFELEFDLRGSNRKNLWGEENSSEQRRLTGDETVPFEGAIPKFLSYNKLVCVTPKDFGNWEIGNQLYSSLGGFHAMMPTMSLLHRLIVRHFTGRINRYKNTWASPPPEVTVEEWKPPIEGLD